MLLTLSYSYLITRHLVLAMMYTFCRDDKRVLEQWVTGYSSKAEYLIESYLNVYYKLKMASYSRCIAIFYYIYMFTINILQFLYTFSDWFQISLLQSLQLYTAAAWTTFPEVSYNADNILIKILCSRCSNILASYHMYDRIIRKNRIKRTFSSDAMFRYRRCWSGGTPKASCAYL